MAIEADDDLYYELYEILLNTAYDDTKRPAHLNRYEACRLALQVVNQDRHGELDEKRLYQIHTEIRQKLGIDK